VSHRRNKKQGRLSRAIAGLPVLSLQNWKKVIFRYAKKGKSRSFAIMTQEISVNYRKGFRTSMIINRFYYVILVNCWIIMCAAVITVTRTTRSFSGSRSTWLLYWASFYSDRSCSGILPLKNTQGFEELPVQASTTGSSFLPTSTARL
jgi:hypothetical protein